MKKRIALFALVGAMLLGSLVGCGEESFSYATCDLDEYLLADESKLDALTVHLPKEYEITDRDVELAIRDILISYREEVSEGKKETDRIIGIGDDVSFYYDLRRPDGSFDETGHALGGGNPVLLTLGKSDSLYPKIEEALTGKTAAPYLPRESGEIGVDEILYLEYYYQDTEDGVTGKEISSGGTVRVDPAAPPEVLGEETRDALVGKSLCEWITVERTPAPGVTREIHVRVRYAVAGELTVETEEGTCFVQVMYMVDHAVPALTASFVTDTVGYFAEEDDPVGAFRDAVRDLLLYSDERVRALDEAILVALEGCFTVLSYPEEKIDMIRKIARLDAEEFYDYCRQYYYDAAVAEYGAAAMRSLDDFILAVNGEAGEGSAEEVLLREARDTVRRSLIIYYFMRVRGWAPDAEKMREEVDEAITSLAASASMTEEQLLERYGDREYFEVQYVYMYVMEKWEETVTIIYD